MTNQTPGPLDREELMLPVLIRWLKKMHRISDGTLVAYELPWLGRRVDLVTMTKRESVTAYELKRRHIQRAIEQAAANRLAFDRSYIVSGSFPNPANIRTAAEAGIGLLVLKGDEVVLVLGSPRRAGHSLVRRRLINRVRERSASNGHV